MTPIVLTEIDSGTENKFILASEFYAYPLEVNFEDGRSKDANTIIITMDSRVFTVKETVDQIANLVDARSL